jgi:hypothetical protein
MPLDSSELELLALTELFHQFPLQIANATQHESCVSQKNQTTFILGDFEVFR